MHGHMNVKFSAKMVKRDGIKKKANVTRPARRLLRQRHRGAAPFIAIRQLHGSNMDPNADCPETCRDFQNCALLGYYAASSGNSLQTFRDKLSVPFEDGGR